jgi:hypothetical protein
VNDDLKGFVVAYRTDGSEIASDSGLEDHLAKVGFTVGADETVVIAVSSDGGRSTGTYTVNTTHPDNLPDDDLPDLGQAPYDMTPDVTWGGNG